MYSATNRLVKQQNLLYREETVPTVTQEYNKHSQKENQHNKVDQTEFDVSKLLLAVNNFFTRTLYDDRA